MMGWRARITIMYLYGMHNYKTILFSTTTLIKKRQKFYMVLKGFPNDVVT